jgi:hypothetical protein
MWVAQFSPQVIAQQIGFDLIECLVELFSLHNEGKPGMITAGQMIALRARLTALTLLAARELLEAPMQFFDLPVQVVRVLDDLTGAAMVSFGPLGSLVNIAARGDRLEQPHLEKDLFEFHEHAGI